MLEHDAMHESRAIACSDASVVPSENAPRTVRDLWLLHGDPFSKKYSDPDLVSLQALIRRNATIYHGQTGFLYPLSSKPSTTYQNLTWDELDRVTEVLAAGYAQDLKHELHQANISRKQPTIALLGEGKTLQYFCTQLALQKLSVRVLLLAEANAVDAVQHLLDICNAVAIVADVEGMSVNTKSLRKISMVVDMPQDVPISSSSPIVEALKFQDYEDVWERHSFIIHSSGSTGCPKPIVHTNRSLMLIARMYRLFQEYEIKNWFLLFPLYHIAGISIALSGLPNGQVTSFPPMLWPPSSSSIFASWTTMAKMGHPVDTTHCAPTLIENMYEYINENGGDFTPLSSLTVLQPGGAALSTTIVKGLVTNGVNVKTTYGSTEIGPVARTIPHTRESSKCYSFRCLYPDNDKIRMEEIRHGVYEMIVYKGFELAAELWYDKPDNEPYRTNDLFVQDPPDSGFFVLQGRKDDILVHSNGEKTSAGPFQLDIQSSAKVIKKVLALGHDRPCVSLLIEVNHGHNSMTETIHDEVWNAVKQINSQYPGHTRVMRSMIYILPAGLTLPVTPKGNVKRKEAESVFAKQIAQLYDDINEDSGYGSESSSSPTESVEDFLRGVLAELSHTPVDLIRKSTTLYELGIDSKLALALRSSLVRRLGPLSLGTIFENPSVGQLLAYFRTTSSHVPRRAQTEVIERLISRYTTELLSWPGRTARNFPRVGGQTIAMTGASGSLGTTLLQTLSLSPQVAKIYALVRGPDPEARLRRSVTSRGLSYDSIMSSNKVSVLSYSMSDTLLGLDISDYAKLAEEATIIIHSAWKMDFNLGLDCYEHDCMRSTIHLLRLAHAGCPKIFAFTSSISTCMGPAAPFSVPESPPSGNPQSALNTGYAQSKYVMERLTQIASSSHLAIPVRLLRVGQLCGSTATGSWSENEMWPILFATSVRLGALPMLANKSVDWIPVDVVADTIRDVVLCGSGDLSDVDAVRHTVHNIVNPRRISWSRLLSMLQSSLHSSSATTPVSSAEIAIIPLKEWVSRLAIEADKGVTADELPGLKLLGFFEGMARDEDGNTSEVDLHDEKNDEIEKNDQAKGVQDAGGDKTTEVMGDGGRVFETEGTMAVSPALRACPPFCEEWLRMNVDWWRRSGFLERGNL